MDGWNNDDISNHDEVYIGSWTNWSHGPTFGATLTLGQRDGNLVIAFSAFFITLVASRCWKIICLVCHQIYSTDQLRDSLHHQRQVVLRNSTSPQDGLWNLTQLAVSRTKLLSKRTACAQSLRVLTPVIFSLLCLGGFTVATYFLPSISSSMGQEVLLAPGACGILQPFGITAQEYNDAYLPYTANIHMNAANYAQQCYSNSSGSLRCARFVKNRVPSSFDTQAACPFQQDTCRSNQSNLHIDTGYIDLHDSFGLNSRPDDRILYRSTLQCAPITTQGYTTTRTLGPRNFTVYEHGSYITGTVTNQSYVEGLYAVENLNDQYLARYFQSSGYPFPARNYQVDAFRSNMQNGSVTPASEFVPKPEFSRHDGDLFIVYLVGNGVLFSQPSNDPWYRATTHLAFGQQAGSSEQYETFSMDEAASPLGCVQQYQFCYAGLPSESRCGVLGSLRDAYIDAQAMAPTTQTRSQLDWLYGTTGQTGVISMPNFLGAYSLTSQQSLYYGIQGEISDRQWQLDVIHWWASSLALIQSTFVENIVGPADPRLQKFVTPPTDPTICSNQKILSASNVSFSIFWLCFLFLAGGLITGISYVLEPVLSCLQRRRAYKQHAYLEWVTNESLQLHRLANEEVGWGTWSRATEAVPVTKAGEFLAGLDLTDAKHPKLERPGACLANGNDGTQEPNDKKSPDHHVTSRTSTDSATSSSPRSGDDAQGDRGDGDPIPEDGIESNVEIISGTDETSIHHPESSGSVPRR